MLMLVAIEIKIAGLGFLLYDLNGRESGKNS